MFAFPIFLNYFRSLFCFPANPLLGDDIISSFLTKYAFFLSVFFFLQLNPNVNAQIFAYDKINEFDSVFFSLAGQFIWKTGEEKKNFRF